MIKIILPQDFTLTIENIKTKKKLTYIDALQYYCELHNVEPETVGKLVQGALKQKVREEAQELHFLPKTTKIPGL
jgi:hypothetical protein